MRLFRPPRHLFPLQTSPPSTHLTHALAIALVLPRSLLPSLLCSPSHTPPPFAVLRLLISHLHTCHNFFFAPAAPAFLCWEYVLCCARKGGERRFRTHFFAAGRQRRCVHEREVCFTPWGRGGGRSGQAVAQGKGVVVVRGKLIEELHVQNARRIIAVAAPPFPPFHRLTTCCCLLVMTVQKRRLHEHLDLFDLLLVAGDGGAKQRCVTLRWGRRCPLGWRVAWRWRCQMVPLPTNHDRLC